MNLRERAIRFNRIIFTDDELEAEFRNIEQAAFEMAVQCIRETSCGFRCDLDNVKRIRELAKERAK
jgi:hypothetical protein